MASKLLLIDANSLIYRAFNAMPYLSTRDGQPTNAAYGFASMLLKLLAEERPEAVAVAFDSPTPTLRHREYQGYKAQRPAMPEELAVQMPLIRELVAALRLPRFEVEGYEADDVLGTLARQGAEAGYEVLILTSDHDTLQLVRDNVHVLATKRGISTLERFGPAEVQRRYGVRPEQIPDFKGLRGDPSDNIPGVPGIGEKTAAKLLQQYGSLEEVLAHAAEVKPPRLRQALTQFAEQARLSKRLATLHTDMPLRVDLAALQWSEPDRERLRELFRRYEFFSLLRRLEASPAQVTAAPPYRLLSTPAAEKTLARALERAAQVALVWAEPSKKEPGGLAVAFSPEEVFFLPPSTLGQTAAAGDLFASLPEPVARLRDRVQRGGLAVWGHDLKSLLLTQEQHGFSPARLKADTLLAAWLLQPGRAKYELSDLLLEHLGRNWPQPPAEGPLSSAAFGACARAEAVMRLVPVLHQALEDLGVSEVYRELELPLVPVLADMTRAGVGIDREYVEQLRARLAAELEELRQEMFRLAGREFNPDSPKQLQKVLFTDLGLTPGHRTKTGYSTDAQTLAQLADQHPLVPKILEYRERAKLKSTYLEVWVELVDERTGRLHTHFNQAGTATGRLSSSRPNLQNIPVRGEWGPIVRRAFVAPGPAWQLLCADYSQIELRLLAHISGDERLCAAFAAGEDIHARAASEIFGVSLADVTPEMRRMGKTINFGIAYGMSPHGLGQRLGVDWETADEYIRHYFERFPGVREYAAKTITAAQEKGYVETLFGRKRFLPELHSSQTAAQQAAERAAINTPIQGTAADIIKRAMIDLHRQLRRHPSDARLVLQIHDELMLEVPRKDLPEVAEMVRSAMEGACELQVPLVVELEVGPNWRDVEPWPLKPN